MTNPPTFAQRIIHWGRAHGRSDLPWQVNPAPYRVWVSEIMLQQTRVETVIGYFGRFMEAFPDVAALARADLDDVLALWSGLGYYARARNLHRAAEQIVAQHGGQVPGRLDDLVALPGIGRSTAGAIRSLGHGLPAAILDGNVKRVLARFHGLQGDLATSQNQRQLWEWSEQKIIDLKEVSAYTQHIMDLGAMLCTAQAPGCASCPLQNDCRAHRDAITHLVPAPKRRQKALPLRSTRMYLAIDQQQRILLEKRPGAGIWGGLWSLPESLDHDAAAARRWPILRHTFTHFQLDIDPVYLHVPRHETGVSEAAGRDWYTIDAALALGIPAPVRKLIQRLQSEIGSQHEPNRALPETG